MKPSHEYYQRDWTVQPSHFAQNYKTSITRSPQQPLLSLQNSLSEATGPVFGHSDLGPLDNDLLRNSAADGLPIGERIIVHGRIVDENAKPIAGTLIELWQANAGGRYRHKSDSYIAPVDPNFSGCGRTLTDDDGCYHFRTVKPGPYPWRNWTNSWRPAHIHFSIFGRAFAQRLVTQMYFEGDPLIWSCPIVNTIPDQDAIKQLIAPIDFNDSVPFDCLAYKFDIVLRGRRSTLFENPSEGT